MQKEIASSVFWLPDSPLVLASGSATRRDLLLSAGFKPKIQPAQIDERAIEAALHREGADPAKVALGLAKTKALAVAQSLNQENPQAYVLGADQTLSLGQRQLHKAIDLSEARSSLEALSGRSHQLHSALVLAQGDCILWSHVETASLHVRTLSVAFIEQYLEQMGSKAFTSVGAYQYEGFGIHLFEHIEGDQSTILGLPLLPLLAELRRRGLVLS